MVETAPRACVPPETGVSRDHKRDLHCSAWRGPEATSEGPRTAGESSRDGIGQTSANSRCLRARPADLDPIRAFPCRPAATLNAPHQQAGHTKALGPMPGIGQGKSLVAEGRPHTNLPNDRHTTFVLGALRLADDMLSTQRRLRLAAKKQEYLLESLGNTIKLAVMS